VTGVAWEDTRVAGDADSQRKLEGIQRRHHSERRALEGTAHTAQSGRGVAASANLGGPQGRARPPVTQQRTPHVHALVDSGCN
jgi:septal ring factor EnvC (AmiA/AmiB activator)